MTTRTAPVENPGVEIAAITSLSPACRRAITNSARELVSLNDQKRELEKEIKPIQDSIKEAVGALGEPKILVPARDNNPAISITYIPGERVSVDPAELIRLGVDPKIVKRATVKTAYFTLKVTALK